MSADAILAWADQLGVQVCVDGDNLKARWKSQHPPPADLIAALRENKSSILAALTVPSDADGWRDHFEERAAIREYDDGVSRDDAVQHWLAKNPLQPSDRKVGCVYCGRTGPDTPILANGGHAWLHRDCWRPLMKRREGEARKVLIRTLGMTGNFDNRQETSTIPVKSDEGA